MFIINHRKIFYAISLLLIVGSVFCVFYFGLKQSVDFSGGSLLQVTFNGEVPKLNDVNAELRNLGYGDASIRTSENGFIIRLKEIDESQKNTILNSFNFGGTFQPVEKTFSTVGPILGKEAVQKSWISIILVLLAIILFIAFAFRKVSKPISSWIYGLVTVLALAHDVIIPTGVFSLLGHLAGFEIDTLFVTALLVILGFSVHDTIVVFDRVRENLLKNENKPFELIVGDSVSQTFIRSLNTSLTTLLAILALYLFGPESVRHFSLTLLIGISVGTYSSIFIGSPLLVTISNWQSKNK